MDITGGEVESEVELASSQLRDPPHAQSLQPPGANAPQSVKVDKGPETQEQPHSSNAEPGVVPPSSTTVQSPIDMSQSLADRCRINTSITSTQGDVALDTSAKRIYHQVTQLNKSIKTLAQHLLEDGNKANDLTQNLQADNLPGPKLSVLPQVRRGQRISRRSSEVADCLAAVVSASSSACSHGGAQQRGSGTGGGRAE